jgi:hypothetical protein
LLQSGTGAFPAVAADAGKIHVVWQDGREGKDEIYYSQSNENGSFTAPINISHTPGVSDLPRVVASKNSVSVVWSDSSTGPYQIMLAQSEDGGKTFSPPRTLSDGMSSTGPPDIASDQGKIFVVWDETQQDGERRIMYWNSTAAARNIAGDKGGFEPSIALRGQRVIVAWHTDVDYMQRVFAALSDDGGQSFSTPVFVSAGLERAVSASAAIGPDGRCVIAWSDQGSGKSDVFVSASDKSGKNYSAPRPIAVRLPESIFPVIQIIGDDDIAVAWTTRTSIIYAHTSVEGYLKETSRTLTTSGNVSAPRLAMDAMHPIVVWSESRGGQSQIAISKDKASGELLFPR